MPTVGELRARAARASAVPVRVHLRTRLQRLRRRARDLTYGAPDFHTVRDDLARRHLAGAGLELGALHRPLRLPPAAKARYVDRLTAADLKARYPEYADRWIVEADVIDDAATLRTVPSASVDFVVANHVLEHMEDPIGALAAWVRVVRPGGVLSLAVPDKRTSFDATRPSTSTAHLDRDHREGPAWSRAQHYEEYAELAERVPAGEAAGRAAELAEADVDIHFHVWDRHELLAFLLHAAAAHGLAFEVVEVAANAGETLVVLRRT